MKSVKVKVCSARNLPKEVLGSNTKYAILTIDGRVRTSPSIKGEDPIWNYMCEFSFEPKINHKSLELNIAVYNKNRVLSDSRIGECQIALKKLLDGEVHSNWYDLVDKKGNYKGEIELEISYIDSRNNKST